MAPAANATALVNPIAGCGALIEIIRAFSSDRVVAGADDADLGHGLVVVGQAHCPGRAAPQFREELHLLRHRVDVVQAGQPDGLGQDDRDRGAGVDEGDRIVLSGDRQ